MKPFLILQLRELDGAADNEFEAFLKYGGLNKKEVHRIRMEKESFAKLNVDDYSGVIVGGGPSNVSDEESIKPEFQKRFESELNALYDQIFEKDIPYFGSCYGLGSVVSYAGGVVSKERYSEEVGPVDILLNIDGKQDPLFDSLPGSFKALCGHKEASQSVPKGGVLLGSSEKCPVQIIRFKNNIYATQFHCELDAEGIAERIRYYKHHGYFDPDSAVELIARTKDIVVEVPQMMLRRFIERYRSV
ncbi:MAG: glutamine amidotransferase [Cyclobacteriaceae bacterium]